MRNSLTLLGAAGALALTACATDPSVSSLSELSHIHNVVVDGDEVLIASHEGLFAETGQDQWSRVGEEFDVMALAEVNGTLLASGHPGRGLDLPDPIGLISSSDGGRTWSPSSLTGDVDFHLLEASGETVIGVAANYGVLARSVDSGATWDTLDVPVFTDVAINPKNQSVVWLATEQGLRRSSDGGSTFNLHRTSAKPFLLDWSDTALYGATSDTVWRWDVDADDWVSIQKGFKNVVALSSSGQLIAVVDDGDLTKIEP